MFRLPFVILVSTLLTAISAIVPLRWGLIIPAIPSILIRIVRRFVVKNIAGMAAAVIKPAVIGIIVVPAVMIF